MTNHYHLLMETHGATLARGMRQLNGVYTRRFNLAHARVGHVYQGRYSAVLVQVESGTCGDGTRCRGLALEQLSRCDRAYAAAAVAADRWSCSNLRQRC